MVSSKTLMIFKRPLFRTPALWDSRRTSTSSRIITNGSAACSISVRHRLRFLPDPIAKNETGYLGWEYPTNRLLQRLPLAKYSSLNIIMWGTVLACLAGVKSFAGAVAVRFFLGVFEAAVTPGFALFTSQVVSPDPSGGWNADPL
jgi:hypothetical protein